jgi:hypothetical protein
LLHESQRGLGFALLEEPLNTGALSLSLNEGIMCA